MEGKGLIRHRAEGLRYVYTPVESHQMAARSALRSVLQTFFGGSLERAVATLLTQSEQNVSDEELTRLADLIERAKEKGHE